MLHCAACGQAQADNARFCGSCGAALPRRCDGCGATLAAGQRFCTSCGHPTDAMGVATPAAGEEPGERRHVTIVFSDLCGYTALNERVDPEDVGQLMAELRDTATGVIETHGGVVNQFVGDEIMSLFGIPQAGRDDALRALRSTLELHGSVRELAGRYAERLGVRVDLHSGINSGLVVTRPCAPHQGRHGVTGDAVNIAARLLKQAGAGDIVVGDDTWRMVSSHFEAERLPPTAVRGKAAPIQPWRVLGEIEARPAAPLIGRDNELQYACAALLACLDGEGARWVVIRGEPGIGKSRLLEELCTAARASGAAVVRTAVPDFGPTRGAAACRILMTALLQLPPAAEPERVAATLAVAGLAGPLHAHVYALLERQLPGPAQAAFAALDSVARERGARDALVALLHSRAAAGGLLVALEDLHWAEAPALTLLARAAAACHERRVLLAVTTRPQSEGFDAARRAHAPGMPALTLDIGPLGDADAQTLARHLAHAEPELVARCVARACGNPLFLEQLLRASGEAVRDSLPGSIQALVLARLDRLAPPDKAALQAASVLGQRVELDAWRSLVDAPRIEPLVEAGLLRPDEGAVHFVHALIRDGAYASLLKTRRRELHQRAADWFAGHDGGLRAEHLALAESPLAAAAFGDAAHAELQRFRYAEALALTGRGQACATTAAERHALAQLHGEALRELGRNAEALAAFEQAREQAASDTETMRSWYEIANVQRLLSQVDAAWQALDAAGPVAERLGDPRWRSRIHYLRGNLCFARGDSALCASEHNLALELARECGDMLAQAQALSGLGDAHYAAGRMHSALESFERCVEACRQAGALRFAVMNQAMVGWCYYWQGRADDCRRGMQAAGEAASALSYRNAEAMVTESTGLMLGWMDDADAARTLERAVDLSHAAGMKRFEMVSRTGLAGARRRAGARDDALALAREAWSMCVEVHAEAFAGPLVLIEIASNTTDADEAEELIAEAEALLSGGAVAHNHLFGYPELMRLRLAQGRHGDVLRLADALEHYVRDEPILWATHHAQVARALVRAARGPRDDELSGELVRLLTQARACQLMQSAHLLDRELDPSDDP